MPKKRTYKISPVALALKDSGASATEFANYLGKSPQVMAYWFKQGVDKSLENNIKCFLAERKGATIKIEGVSFD